MLWKETICRVFRSSKSIADILDDKIKYVFRQIRMNFCPKTASIIIIIIIKDLFTVGYNTIVYPRPGKLIHTNYLGRYNILTKIII